MSNKYKIVLVDDHKLFREGLKFVISEIDDFKVVGEAADGKEFLKMIGELEIDLVLMDISMPNINGIEASQRALEKHPELKILALSMFGDEEYYYKMIQVGVKGFVLKESGKEELEKAMREILNGENYFSQKLLTDIIMNLDSSSPISPRTSQDIVKFTKRELEVLNLICTGSSNIEIADKLFLSLRTIEGHKSKLISKTGVKNSIGLVMYAIKNKIVEI